MLDKHRTILKRLEKKDAPVCDDFDPDKQSLSHHPAFLWYCSYKNRKTTLCPSH